MATKHFCDGCDQEVPVRDLKPVSVADLSRTPIGDRVLNNPRDFDLCGSCYSRFKNSHWPSNWPRVSVPSPDAA